MWGLGILVRGNPVTLPCRAAVSFHLQRPTVPCQTIRWTIQTSQMAAAAVSYKPGGLPFAFCSCAMPHGTATCDLINHSAVIQHRHRWKLPCPPLWAPGWNYLQWVGSAEKHPGMDLLPGRLWVMPLFQSEPRCRSHLLQQLIRNVVWRVVFQLLENGETNVGLGTCHHTT